MKPKQSWLKKYLKQFIITQCAVTLVALPITTCWGLAFSIASPLGNLIFSPILGLFLVISSLVFFTTLLGIPNGIFCQALEWITQIWTWMLHCGSKSWLIGFAQPPAWMLIALPLIMYVIMTHQTVTKKFSTLTILLSATLFNLLFLWGYTFCMRPATTQLECLKNKKGNLVILHHPDASLSLIDYGYFRGSLSADKIVNYELRTYFLKKYGTLNIRSLHLQKASRANFIATQGLCTIGNIQQLKIPYFSHELTKSGWRNYFALKRISKKYGVKTMRFKDPKNKFTKRRAPTTARPTKIKQKKSNKSAQLINKQELD